MTLKKHGERWIFITMDEEEVEFSTLPGTSGDALILVAPGFDADASAASLLSIFSDGQAFLSTHTGQLSRSGRCYTPWRMSGAAMIRSAALCLLATPVTAERIECVLTESCNDGTACEATPVPLVFGIDRSQFSAPVDPNEPPRRKVTEVRLGDVGFIAEAMVIGDVLGFWEDTEAMGERMFTLQPDGIGTYTESPSGLQMIGPCEVSR